MFVARNAEGASYTVFSDSTAAFTRAMSDRIGPGQTFANAFVEVAERLVTRGRSTSLRWARAHKVAEGNEMADAFAKAAAVDASGSVEQQLLRQASPPHLTRATTEARAQGTRDWVSSHVRSSRRYRPPRGRGVRPDLREKKGGGCRFFQLLSGHAPIGSYLAERTHTISSSTCLCGSGKR